jgi:hypothetical protein
MNRIREHDNKYQVLITPHHKFDYNVEFLLGNWTDAHLSGYQVIIYDTIEEAMVKSFSLPNLDWDLLVLHHKDIYIKLRTIIRNILQESNMKVNFKSTLTDPIILKNIMFNRVIINGDRFRLGENLNDIITFTITNPWTQNLKELRIIFENIPQLRIQSSFVKNGIVSLIGKTDIGTLYTIILNTNLLHQWSIWASESNTSQYVKNEKLKQIIAQQNQLDLGVNIR